MKCEDVSAGLSGAIGGAIDPPVAEHLAACEDCRNALRAVEALHAEREAPVPEPRAGAWARVLRAASAAPPATVRPARGFWTGLAVGAAAAAAAVAVLSALDLPGDTGAAAPSVTLALHRPQEVSIGIDSAAPLTGVEIHVALHGAIDLRGFEGQRDLHWITDLDSGVNELTLPVVATGPSGGQLVVEVHHGGERRRFRVDVRATASDDAA